MRLILTFIFTTLFIQSHAQIWPKIYGSNIHKGGMQIYEAYDAGYLITGNFTINSWWNMGFIMKTDINGDIHWEKHFGDSGYRFPITCSYHSSDGGMIISGYTNKFDNLGDTYLMKLNPCMEQQWCNIFHIPGHYHSGWDVIEMPDGTFIALLNMYSYDMINERIWLLCLSPDGTVLWEKLYCQSPDKHFINEVGYRLLLTADNNILITGDCWKEYPANSNTWWLHTLHIKVDSAGEEVWVKPFGEDIFEHFSSEPNRTVECPDGSFYTCGRTETDPLYNHMVGGFMKFDAQGNDISWIRVYPNHQHHAARITNMMFFDQNHLILTGGYKWAFEQPHNMLYKTDTLGTILHEKELYRGDAGISHAMLTTDNYAIMTAHRWIGGANGRWRVYINKVDGELNEAEFDPRQLTYDSLCPYPIVTDTIVPVCDIILGHRPPELTDKEKTQQLEVFPNPASAYATIKLPESVSRSGHNGFMTHTTVWHHWIKDATLHVFNIHGQQIHTQSIPDGQQQLQLDVSAWPPGVYLLRVKAMNGITVDGKIMIQR
jgi:hypothetical protein